jgi:SagB-type dehydrogenase family enzyme
MSGHYLDWDNRPSPFKIYKNLPSIPLLHNFLNPPQDALKSIRGEDSINQGRQVDLQNLSEVLFFSAGLARRMRFGNEIHYMRAASATGALYPIELYVVSSGIQGLKPGIFHFNPLSFALIQIRDRDCSELAEATAEATASSPVTIVFTSMAWRNAWKYEARSYRHWFWDAGVMAANLLATCSSETLNAKLLMGFVDSEIDQILGLEKEGEATVALATIGHDGKKSENGQPTRTQLDLTTEPISKSQEKYPIIWETNGASELHNRAEVNSWRKPLTSDTVSTRDGTTFPLPPPVRETRSLGEVILRRGSTRRFAQKSISLQALSTIIHASTGHIPIDFLSNDNSLTEFYFIANDVEGLPSGAYHYDRMTKCLDQLKQESRLRYVSGYLCLEQLLFSDASVVFFLMTDLRRVLNDLGDRGYRAAQFEAGIRAGKIYLSAYALGIGASGSTFYDDAVTEFFSPHAKGMSTMIAVGIGVPAYKAKPGKILPQFTPS